MLGIRLRIVLLLATSIYFVIIFSLLKRKSLNLKYSLLWLLSGAIMGLLIIFPNILFLFTRIVGIQMPMHALLVFCVAFILVILMSITSIVSRQNQKIRTLIQINAMLEKRVRDLEKTKNDTIKV